MDLKSKFIAVLDKAGITVNGGNPWDLQVHDEAFYGMAPKKAVWVLAMPMFRAFGIVRIWLKCFEG